MAKIGEPISVKDMLEAGGGKSRAVVPKLTSQMENAIQSGVDQINKGNLTAGTKLIATQW